MPEEVYSSIISERCREKFFDAKSQGARALMSQSFRGCGTSKLRPPYFIRRLTPATHAVIYTLHGGGWLKTAGKTFTLLPGSVLMLPAHTDHEYGTSRFWHTLWFHMSPVPRWNCLVPDHAAVHAATCVDRLGAVGHEFLLEMENAARSDNAEILGELARLFSLFLRRELAACAPRDSTTLQRNHLERLWETVLRHPDRGWTIQSLAREAGVSRSHLHFLMKKLYGLSAMEKVAHLRMDRAIQLLFDRARKLSDIAEEVGYDSPYSFSRAFKRIVGVSPLQYRSTRAAACDEDAAES